MLSRAEVNALDEAQFIAGDVDKILGELIDTVVQLGEWLQEAADTCETCPHILTIAPPEDAILWLEGHDE